MEIIDADGHVNDAAGQEEIARYMPAGNRSSQIFPVLDHGGVAPSPRASTGFFD